MSFNYLCDDVRCIDAMYILIHSSHRFWYFKQWSFSYIDHFLIVDKILLTLKIFFFFLIIIFLLILIVFLFILIVLGSLFYLIRIQWFWILYSFCIWLRFIKFIVIVTLCDFSLDIFRFFFKLFFIIFSVNLNQWSQWVISHWSTALRF